MYGCLESSATELELFGKHQEAGAIISDSEHWLQDTQYGPRASRRLAWDRRQPTSGFFPAIPVLWVDVSLFSTCCVIVKRASWRPWAASL